MVGKHSSTTGLTIQMRNYMKELVVRDFWKILKRKYLKLYLKMLNYTEAMDPHELGL
jgi:hypothetical protein